MCCSARRASNPTLRAERLTARSLSTTGRSVPPRLECSVAVPLGVTRIGVHAGPAIVGNFGGGRLFDYTAYGDTVNAAARLEAVNKTLGTRICVSAIAVERAGEFFGRPVGDLVLRGRSEPLRAYEPLRGKPRRGGILRSGLRQAGGERPHRHRRLRRAGRRETRRRAGAVSSQAAAEWRIRNSLGDVVKAPSPACGRGLG